MTDCIRVGPDTTRKDLIAQGVTEEGADELMDYQTYLLAKEAGDFDGDYEDWREVDAYCPKCVSEKCDVPVSSLGTGNWIYCAEHSADPAPPEQDGERGQVDDGPIDMDRVIEIARYNAAHDVGIGPSYLGHLLAYIEDLEIETGLESARRLRSEVQGESDES